MERRPYRASGKQLSDWFFRQLIDDDECLIWPGARNSDGYGSLGMNGKTVGAHRLSFELAHGPIPPGMAVLHQCDNPPCCNPAHLHLGTQEINAAERHARGRAWQNKITHCPQGHPYNELNTRLTKKGYRICKQCDYARPRRGRKGSPP